jgi:hypothetical protein
MIRKLIISADKYVTTMQMIFEEWVSTALHIETNLTMLSPKDNPGRTGKRRGPGCSHYSSWRAFFHIAISSRSPLNRIAPNIQLFTQVATLDYLRDQTSIPVPRILQTSYTREDNARPYIVLERVMYSPKSRQNLANPDFSLD